MFKKPKLFCNNKLVSVKPRGTVMQGLIFFFIMERGEKPPFNASFREHPWSLGSHWSNWVLDAPKADSPNWLSVTHWKNKKLQKFANPHTNRNPPNSQHLQNFLCVRSALDQIRDIKWPLRLTAKSSSNGSPKLRCQQSSVLTKQQHQDARTLPWPIFPANQFSSL